MRRYDNTPVINGGKQYGTSDAIVKIREGIKSQTIRFQTVVMQGGERLDTIAGKYYGDGRLWWILAAASNIGFMPQCPPGTLITIPNLEDVGAQL